MINVFIISILSNCLIFSFGTIFYKYFLKENILDNNINEVPLFGIIILSFFTLFINFFYPINKAVGSIILGLGLFLLILEIYKNKNFKSFFLLISLSSLLCTILISYSNVYRPDAGLYHLPFISMINENKIIIGSANIHFRFGTTSIVQYLSASHNNLLFNTHIISIPLASIFSFTILYLIREIYKVYNKNEYLKSIFIFLLSCICLITFGRFSNYGNDAVSHLYFYVLIVFYINYFKNYDANNNYFNKIFLVSIFLLSTKAFMSISILFPISLFFLSKKKYNILSNRNFYFISFLLIIWLIRSILISGCLVYPLNQTCLKTLKFYDGAKTVIEAKAGEAWSKDWVNQKENKLSYDKFNKDFNWVETWRNNHLNKIFQKLSPVFLFFFIFTAYVLLIKKKEKYKFDKELIHIFFISFIFSILWFLKFPLYRYGSSFLIVVFILFFIYLLNLFKKLPKFNNLLNIFKIFLIVSFAAFFLKNSLRIYNNFYEKNYNVWPDIYSEYNNKNVNKFTLKKNNDKKLYYFSAGKLCMYSKSPCSNYDIKNLKKENLKSYQIYYISD